MINFVDIEPLVKGRGSVGGQEFGAVALIDLALGNGADLGACHVCLIIFFEHSR